MQIGIILNFLALAEFFFFEEARKNSDFNQEFSRNQRRSKKNEICLLNHERRYSFQ